MPLRLTMILTVLFLATSVLFGQEVVTITDADISPGQTVTFSKNKTYLLDGFVFVDSTATLTIEAGTVIKGKPGEGAGASALVVARGGKLFAQGTKDEPIIFTAEADDVADPDDLTHEDRGLWGGLIILGNASINVAGGEEQIEGIPVTEPRGAYGGTVDDDNSGVLRYVSVRHGGSNIGANNEINGVTFGGVGSGTTVDHIEVFANADDGYEWFGGTVNCSYLVSAFNGDDGFDWDEGFRGMGQFWFVIQDAAVGNSAFECDGGTTPEDGTPYSIPQLYNITAIGSGVQGANAKNTPLLNLRDNSGGKFYNSIFLDGRGYAVQVEDLASGEDSRSRLENEDLVFNNNIWFGFKDGIADAGAGQDFLLSYLTNPTNVNDVSDPMIAGVDRGTNKMLDPRVNVASPAYSNVLPTPDNGFFQSVNYRGAFNANNLWVKEWTFLDDAGYLVDLPSGVINITDADIKPGDNLLWTANNTYILDGFVFVDSTATLTIEPGTVIKGKPGEGANASALIVARGGKLYANGTEQKPIIFTAESDDVQNPSDLTQDDRGLWGGLIILGKASINVAGGEEQIEGIPVTEPRGAYGGTVDTDNSGVIKYVSVRHGGSNIGANNEINGVTFGGVGNGTEVHHIEVFANNDDGYEWFGGTVNCTYLVSAYNGDDSFDWDEGFRGKGQFWFALQSATVGNSAFECDGGTTPEDGTPYSIPVLSNVTAIGSGASGANAKNTPFLNLRDNSGGKFYNSIFTDARGYGVQVEDLASGEDSRSRLESKDLVFENNLWFDLKNGLADATSQQFMLDYLQNPENGNSVADPQLSMISRSEDAQLDPRPAVGGPAFENVKTMTDPFFRSTEYRGAFGQGAGSNWLANWTFLWQGGLVTDVAEEDRSGTLAQTVAVYPNPANTQAIVRFTATGSELVRIALVSTTGATIATLTSEQNLAAGLHEISVPTASVASGSYLIVITNQTGTTTVPLTIVR